MSIRQLLLLAVLAGLFGATFRAAERRIGDDVYERVVFSPGGRLLLTNASERGVEVWRLDQHWPRATRLRIEQAFPEWTPHAIGFVDDRTVFVVAYDAPNAPASPPQAPWIGGPVPERTLLVLWDVERNAEASRLVIPYVSPSVAIGLSSRKAVTMSMGLSPLTRTLDIWELSTQQRATQLTSPTPLGPFDISNDGRTLVAMVAVGRMRGVRVIDVETGEVRGTLDDDDATMAFFTPRDGRIVTFDEERNLTFWDRETLAPVGQARHTGLDIAPHIATAFTDDESRMAIAESSAVRTWDLATFQELESQPLDPVLAPLFRSVAISPDGKTLAMTHGRADLGISLCELPSGAESRRIGRPYRLGAVIIFLAVYLAWSFVWRLWGAAGSARRAAGSSPAAHPLAADEPEDREDAPVEAELAMPLTDAAEATQSTEASNAPPPSEPAPPRRLCWVSLVGGIAALLIALWVLFCTPTLGVDFRMPVWGAAPYLGVAVALLSIGEGLAATGRKRLFGLLRLFNIFNGDVLNLFLLPWAIYRGGRRPIRE